MKSRKRLAALLCLISVCFAGCGQAKVPETIEKSTIIVSDKGQITVHLVEDFDKTYYDLSELTAMARDEAAEYNKSKQKEEAEGVAVEQVELLEPAKVKLTYRFGNWENYTEFNEGQFFYGTVNEADENGYLSGVSLKSVKDGSQMNEEQLKENGDRKLIITDADMDIYCPGKVIYISENAAVNEDGSVATAKAEGLVYILIK